MKQVNIAKLKSAGCRVLEKDQLTKVALKNLEQID